MRSRRGWTPPKRRPQAGTHDSAAAKRACRPASQVDFEEGFAIEGAKEVSTVSTRHVTRLLRPWLAAHEDRWRAPAPPPPPRLRRVSPSSVTVTVLAR